MVSKGKNSRVNPLLCIKLRIRLCFSGASVTLASLHFPTWGSNFDRPPKVLGTHLIEHRGVQQSELGKNRTEMSIETFCKELDSRLVSQISCEEKVQTTEAMLTRLAQQNFSTCPSWLCCDRGYARYLVYRGAESGCCVVAMAWAPGQGTSVHDHDGVWCVECCLEGQLEVVRYELHDILGEKDDAVYLFSPMEAEQVGEGSVGSLIPPFEHHSLCNGSKKRAITLHVYGKELLKSSKFVPLGGHRYRREECELSYSAKA